MKASYIFKYLGALFSHTAEKNMSMEIRVGMTIDELEKQHASLRDSTTNVKAQEAMFGFKAERAEKEAKQAHENARKFLLQAAAETDEREKARLTDLARMQTQTYKAKEAMVVEYRNSQEQAKAMFEGLLDQLRMHQHAIEQTKLQAEQVLMQAQLVDARRALNDTMETIALPSATGTTESLKALGEAVEADNARETARSAVNAAAPEIAQLQLGMSQLNAESDADLAVMAQELGIADKLQLAPPKVAPLELTTEATEVTQES